jgi:hypothetical protein
MQVTFILENLTALLSASRRSFLSYTPPQLCYLLSDLQVRPPQRPQHLDLQCTIRAVLHYCNEVSIHVCQVCQVQDMDLDLWTPHVKPLNTTTRGIPTIC